jgi:hypothetical protein
MEVDGPQCDNELEPIKGRLGKAGIDLTLAESLADNVLAQVLIDHLANKIEGLQEELG